MPKTVKDLQTKWLLFIQSNEQCQSNIKWQIKYYSSLCFVV